MVSPSADYKQFASIREPGPQGEVLHIFGDVDCLSAEEFAVAIEEAITVDEMLIVNLTRCRYMDTTGLSTLVRAKKRFGSSLMGPRQGEYAHRAPVPHDRTRRRLAGRHRVAAARGRRPSVRSKGGNRIPLTAPPRGFFRSV